MDPIVQRAEQELRRSPHPALRIAELLDLVRGPLDRSLDASRLRGLLERHPELFRVLDPWRGPWRPLVAREGAASADGEAWAVILTHPDSPPPDTDPTVQTLRESVRWMSRGIDPRSPGDVARWHAIALAERRLRGASTRRAA